VARFFLLLRSLRTWFQRAFEFLGAFDIGRSPDPNGALP